MAPLSSHSYSRGQASRAVVVGAGVIGLAVARELAREGWCVVVLERTAPGSEASSAAAGMLAPHGEFVGDSPLFRAGLESRAMYPSFVAELEDETGIDVDLRLDGLLVPLEAAASSPAAQFSGRRVNGDEARSAEPGLSPDVEAALIFDEDGSVDNRALVRALAASCRSRGVEIRCPAAVTEVITDAGRVRGVRVQGRELSADAVINCAGAWAGSIRVPGGEVVTRPIKGQMVAVDTRRAQGSWPRRVIYSHEAYLVPRSDGRVVIGTTVEDRGFDKSVEPSAVARLLAGATRLWPSIARAPVAESWAGLRPLGVTELPRIGAHGPEGYFVAVGHYRNGILLAPLTARVLAARILRREVVSPL